MNETLTAIANLYDKLYYEIIDIVEKHHGYINTSNNGTKDTIYALWYDFYYDFIGENEILGIRVINNKLQILLSIDSEDNHCEEWAEISSGNTVYFFQTLYNIAENINQYL